LVLEAAALQARHDGDLLLVEATSNQVDQYGGYTGMSPTDFVALVEHVARLAGLPEGQVVLGGDHLGPNRWRDLGAAEAMDRAETLVAAYVEAGFSKIHLDCSMECAGDPSPLPGTLVAERAARLARAAQKAAAEREQPADLVYVIGTEVPVPGGAQETIDSLTPTAPEAARVTMAEHRAAFAEAGVPEAWDRVVALVVQPGVEFDHTRVFDYDPAAARELSAVAADQRSVVFEAHSTDYQTRSALAGLVRDHWAVLKVGPGLTFALREALFALAAIEDELIAEGQRSDLVRVLEDAMIAEPGWWRGYYEGTPAEQRQARRYSYSDRSRYYWPAPELSSAVETLLANLDRVGIPLPMLSQHLPHQYERVRTGVLPHRARDLVVDHVRDVLRDYAYACGNEGARA
jgi:D-tagatose-1,6-bisphosphate aldolase subunit GatZ/KbaZ